MSPALDRRSNLPGLFLSSVLLLAAVHSIALVVEHGVGRAFVTTILTPEHAVLWMVIAAALLVAGASMRSNHGVMPDPIGPGAPVTRRSMVRRFVLVYLGLVSVTVVAYLALENVEGILASGDVGLGPMAQIGQPLVAAAMLTLAAAIAVGASRPKPGTASYEATLRASYAEEVRSGTYSATFEHSDWAQAFVRTAIERVARNRPLNEPIRFIECGCGTGAWLEFVARVLGERAWPVRLVGFDLSPDMVDQATERLARHGVVAEVRVGDVLDDATYDFDGDRYTVAFAYDVIQQLPRQLQLAAVKTMLRHCEPGGWLLIFDHDARSRYGRTMGTKKWLRRHLGIPLVPGHYIHARYPDLHGIAREVNAVGASASIVVEREGRHRALVVRLPSRDS